MKKDPTLNFANDDTEEQLTLRGGPNLEKLPIAYWKYIKELAKKSTSLVGTVLMIIGGIFTGVGGTFLYEWVQLIRQEVTDINGDLAMYLILWIASFAIGIALIVSGYCIDKKCASPTDIIDFMDMVETTYYPTRQDKNA